MAIPREGELWVFYGDSNKINDELEDALNELAARFGYKRIGSGYGDGGFTLGIARDIQYRQNDE